MTGRPRGTEGCWSVEGRGMADTTIRRSWAFDYFGRFKRRWQRGLVVEFTLIGLFVAFAAFEILYFLGRMAS